LAKIINAIFITLSLMHKILLTGGAGFIGSNLLTRFLNLPEVSLVRVLDNLETGYEANFQAHIHNPKFEFVHGSIANYNSVHQAMQGITHVSHQAALGSVPRSIDNPLATNQTNIDGTLNIFTAAKENNVKRVVFAASSSTYGDSENLPKVENIIGKPLSPYAVTKYVMELYADVFARIYNFEYIGLRYFNVFGPHQSPTGAYAAVIPLFMDAILKNEAPLINGDGTNSRDFTFIENVVAANERALFTENKQALNQIFNIAYGQSTTLNQLFDYIKEIAKSDLKPNYGPNRVGDIPHSLASISKAKELLGYQPLVSVQEGLQKAWDWYMQNQQYFK
jgi:UDP-N-acetylglucosamine/UDP-N-acetylgalactosamine 4-epimerase